MKNTNLDLSPDFEYLLQYLKQTRGCDFTGYKRSTLQRRINKRMQEVNILDYTAYQDYLEVHPEEFITLFNTILINVTSFFRDVQAWEHLSQLIIPRILEQKEPNETIRIWTAGCASGEEAFTLAIVFAEQMGLEAFREQVKIYATDIDQEALGQARIACYPLKQMENISSDLLKKYFYVTEEGDYAFIKQLRRSIIFGRHNLVSDAPISRLDLLNCRNTLMYFNAETQAKILSRFHFALNDNGFLFLGKAETLLANNAHFTPVDLKQRIFRKVRNSNVRDRLWLLSQGENDQLPDYYSSMSNYVRLREAAFDATEIAQIVVDLNGIVVLINQQARELFNLSNRDVGRPFKDLEVSYRPVELRSRIDQLYAERNSIVLKDIEWPSSGKGSRFLEIKLRILTDTCANQLGVSLNFIDITSYKQLKQELENSSQELEMAYEELQSTNEELETTNEELQSAVEELETTNEELQSTNEELETMNEELQSSNEELQTINDELTRRSNEFNSVNAFFVSILTSLQGAIVVLNQELLILVWNSKAEDLWGLRTDEVQDQHFLNLDIGLPVDQLLPFIRKVLSGESRFEEVVLKARNRRGWDLQCQVKCTPLVNLEGSFEGVVLLMDEMKPSSQ